MNCEQARRVKEGDLVHIQSLWSRTIARGRDIASPTAVLGIREADSQTGILFHVKDVHGASHWLDAGWFYGE